MDISGDALEDELCMVLVKDRLYYMIVDDFHLLRNCAEYRIPEIKCCDMADTKDRMPGRLFGRNRSGEPNAGWQTRGRCGYRTLPIQVSCKELCINNLRSS